MSAKIIVCCGAGGVGKTTISAALSIKYALAGSRVAVLTIDPAKRLVDSLQIGELRNEAVPVPLPHGTLDAMMLDPAQTFDNFTKTHATSPKTAERLLRNRYYRFASRRMGGVQEYMAMVRLVQLSTSKQYDVVVLDTPPTRNALDFLHAPERMGSLMDKSALKWLASGQSGWRALSLGTEMIAKGLRIFLGSQMIDEIGEFFDCFTTIGSKMHEQAMQCNHLLKSQLCRFFLVTAPHRNSSTDLEFVNTLRDKELPFGGFLINRALPKLSIPQQISLSQEARDWLEWSRKAHHQEWKIFSKKHELLQKESACWLIPEQADEPNSIPMLTNLGPYLPQL